MTFTLNRATLHRATLNRALATLNRARAPQLLPLLLLAFILVACGKPEIVADYPEPRPEGNTGTSSVLDNFPRAKGALGVSIGGANNQATNNTNAATTANSVSPDLWRASLDTLSFLPLSTADQNGGVIITDWYEDTAAPNTRFKINVIISGRALRSDNLRLSVFREIRDESGAWRTSATANDPLPRQLENIILTRARDFYLRRGAQ